MNTKTFEQLKSLYDTVGGQEFGKLCQKLLAIAFQKAGYSCVAESERGVQGVDIGEVEKGDEKYSIEVKTTTTDYVTYEKKDEEGLKYKKEKGYTPVLAVLKLDRFSDWFFIKADSLKVGRIYIDSLRPFRMHNLEQKISPYFEKTVEEHYKGALQHGQSYLDNVLKQKREIRKV